MNIEELLPKEKEYSIIIIDLWDEDAENAAFKLTEVNNDELQKSIEEIRNKLSEGDYVMVYNRNGETVDI